MIFLAISEGVVDTLNSLSCLDIFCKAISIPHVLNENIPWFRHKGNHLEVYDYLQIKSYIPVLKMHNKTVKELCLMELITKCDFDMDEIKSHIYDILHRFDCIKIVKSIVRYNDCNYHISNSSFLDKLNLDSTKSFLSKLSISAYRNKKTVLHLRIGDLGIIRYNDTFYDCRRGKFTQYNTIEDVYQFRKAKGISDWYNWCPPEAYKEHISQLNSKGNLVVITDGYWNNKFEYNKYKFQFLRDMNIDFRVSRKDNLLNTVKLLMGCSSLYYTQGIFAKGICELFNENCNITNINKGKQASHYYNLI